MDGIRCRGWLVSVRRRSSLDVRRRSPFFPFTMHDVREAAERRTRKLSLTTDTGKITRATSYDECPYDGRFRISIVLWAIFSFRLDVCLISACAAAVSQRHPFTRCRLNMFAELRTACLFSLVQFGLVAFRVCSRRREIIRYDTIRYDALY